MSTIDRLAAVTLLNLRTIPARVGDSLVIVIGIAGVVAVLVVMLSMAAGFRRTVENSGREDRAIVLSSGGQSEISSFLARADVATISDAPGVRRNAAGKPLASAEALALAPVKRARDGSDAFVTLRGLGTEGYAMRNEFVLTSGRMFRPAVKELLVGRAAQTEFAGLAVGNVIRLSEGDWTIVGSFTSGGSSHESGLLADAQTVLSAYRSNFFNSVTVLLDSPQLFRTFKNALTSNPTLVVDVQRESDYFASMYAPFTRMLRFVSYVVGGIMAVGALFAALNTMYSAVSVRSKEIATLRALGFGRSIMTVSIFIEALLLSAFGALIGVTLAYVMFDGNAISSVAEKIGNNPQIVYAIKVTPGVAMTSVGVATAIGLIGAAYPALRAARLSVTAGLREI